MNRNLDLPMLDLEGKPYPDAATLRDLAFAACRANLPSDEKASLTKKREIYGIAVKVVQGGVVELTIEQLKMLQERIGEAMTPIVAGQAFEMLERDFVEPLTLVTKKAKGG